MFCLWKLIKEQSHPQHSRSVVSGPASATSALQTLRAMAAAARDVRSCEPTSASVPVSTEASQTDKPHCQVDVFTGVISSPWEGAVVLPTVYCMTSKKSIQTSVSSGSEAAKDLKYSCAGKAPLWETCQFIETS